MIWKVGYNHMGKQQKGEKQEQEKLPIVKNEDVDYNTEFADDNDREAVDRAAQADKRQQ
jgi:hypothetical protein